MWRIDPNTEGRIYCFHDGNLQQYGKDSDRFGLEGAAVLATGAALLSISLMFY